MSAPRVLIAIMGLDGHEVGALAVTGMLRDAGMEVLYAGRFNTPATIARTAVEEDVDVVGLSMHSWEFVALLPELMARLREEKPGTPVTVGGSILTRADMDWLAGQGVAAVFGPGAAREDIVTRVRELAAAGHSAAAPAAEGRA